VGSAPNVYSVWYDMGEDKATTQQTRIYADDTHFQSMHCLDFTLAHYFYHRTFVLRYLPLKLALGDALSSIGLLNE
jgi:hypothetical protein